jgi:hypothetical protein
VFLVEKTACGACLRRVGDSVSYLNGDGRRGGRGTRGEGLGGAIIWRRYSSPMTGLEA